MAAPDKNAEELIGIGTLLLPTRALFFFFFPTRVCGPPLRTVFVPCRLFGFPSSSIDLTILYLPVFLLPSFCFCFLSSNRVS